MAVIIKNGIGVSTRSGALMMTKGVASIGEDGALFKAPPIANQSGAEWSPWGDNNLLPVEMADHIENCGVLNAALDAKARIGVGKGLQPFLLMNVTNDGKEELDWVSDAEIQDWMEANDLFDFAFDSSYDVNAFGWSCATVIQHKSRSHITRIKRKDIVGVRLQKKKANGFIENIYECNDWKQAGNAFDNTKMISLPALKEGYEAEDLMARKSDYEFAILNRRLRNGRGYYPLPLWYAARAWVKVARSIPAMKNSMFQNQMTLKYVINISEKYWSDHYEGFEDMKPEAQLAIQQAKYDEIEEYLVGEDKQYKTLISGTWFDTVNQKHVPYIDIQVLDDKVKDGKLLPDSSAANSEILFALMMNPALIGAGQPGGPYSNNAGGSNIRESYLVQLMIMEAERRMNTRYMNIIKQVNGWGKRLEKKTSYIVPANGSVYAPRTKEITPRLVFRYPSGLLTTLDTGKSTKSENV